MSLKYDDIYPYNNKVRQTSVLANTCFHMVWVERKEVHHNCMVKHQKKECLCFYYTLRKVDKNKTKQKQNKRMYEKKAAKKNMNYINEFLAQAHGL